MSDQDNKSEWLRSHEASIYIGVSTATLARYRRLKLGPRFSRVGRLAIYARTDIDEWMASRVEPAGNAHTVSLSEIGRRKGIGASPRFAP